MRPDRRARAAGFTLLELLVVIVLISLLAGIASLSVGDGMEDQLAMADLQVRDALAWAQTLARSRREPVGVVFDPAGERFAVVDQSGAQVEDPLTRRGYEIAFPRPNQPRRVDLSSADFGACGPAVIFDAQGVPLTGGTITLTAGGHVRTLVVDAATGYVASS